MTRHAFVLLIFIGLSALASAQGERPALTAAQQQVLFQRNRGMIQTLVDSSLKISTHAGAGIERARSYLAVATQFQKELDQAAGDGDVSRVSELGKHLNVVLRQGLTPSLRAAHSQIGPNGTGWEDLVQLRDGAMGIFNDLQYQSQNKWADTPEAREVIDALEKTQAELFSSMPGK